MVAQIKVTPKVLPILAPARKATSNNGFTSPIRPPCFSPTTSGAMPPWLRSGSPVITAEKIPIAKELTDDHWLKDYILQKEPISSSSILKAILEILENTVNLTVYENGAIPASTNKASKYSENSWRRDNAIMTLAMLQAVDVEDSGSGGRQELIETAKKELIDIASFDNQPLNRGRFTSFFFLDRNDPSRNRYLAKEKFKKDINGLPRQIASITEDGGLGEYYDWGHNQLDGLGASLFAFFNAANLGILDLKELDKKLTEQNQENSADSLFSVALHLLHEIEYWDQMDLGPWEKIYGHKRASSIGICLSAFKEAKKYFESNGWNSKQIITVNPNVNLKTIIDEGIKYGEAALNERIPSDGRDAVETNEIPSDSALAFLLLFNPGLSEAQEKAILKRVYEQMGEYGIRRMSDHIDNFMGQNYALNPNGKGVFSELIQDHKAAQWTLFDPILGAFYYRKYIESEGLDEESFKLADKHFKRTLSQITKHDYIIEQFVNQHEKITVNIPAGVLPEARWLRKHDDQEIWLPNTNSPLQMSHAVFAIMIAEATKAIKLKENLDASNQGQNLKIA